MDFTAPQTAQTNGITMEYFEQGEGPAVLLLHGFPEHPFSWRNQVDPIAAAGFRVIVPSQRGYAGTDAPADAQTYSVKNLVADVSGLLDALGIDQAVWFGHDWGSMPAWYSGVFDPERVLGLGSLCTPYFTWEAPQDMIEIYDEVRGPNHYMRTFQEPGVGEGILGDDVEHTFRSMLRGRGYTMDRVRGGAERDHRSPGGRLRRRPAALRRPDRQRRGAALLRRRLRAHRLHRRPQLVPRPAQGLRRGPGLQLRDRQARADGHRRRRLVLRPRLDRRHRGAPAPGREARHPRRRPLAAAGEARRGQRDPPALAAENFSA